MNPVLVVGRGTLGSALLESEWLRARPRRRASLHAERSADRLDITRAEEVSGFFEREGPFSLVINAAAMSGVDRCEEFPEEARRINALGAKHLAQAAEKNAIPLIHISTDYVFGGDGTQPIRPQELRAPRSVYGLTKLEAEYAVETAVSRYALIRTTWLFGPYREDFVNTTLGRLARQESFGVISDQYGSPTYAKDLADGIGRAVILLEASAEPLPLKLHMVNRGVTTRYEMTAVLKKVLRSASEVLPISKETFTGWKAVRPVYSALEIESTESRLGISLRGWEEALSEYALSASAVRWIQGPAGSVPAETRETAK